jgi:outer membrane biogenesis lipoprotein LolB
MKLFITLLAILFLFAACKDKEAEAASTNWQKSEHNYNIQL